MPGNIADLASEAARKYGGSVAFTMAGEARAGLTFERVDAFAGRLAAGLAAKGVKKGDRVLLYLSNGYDWIVAYHAIVRLGAVVVPANILLSSNEITFIAANCNPAVAILAKEKREVDVGRAIKIIADGMTEESTPNGSMAESSLPPATVVSDDLCAICYTSGTTGTPKGAMLTHGNVFSSVAMTATIHARSRHDLVFSALPLPHVYGNAALNSCFLTGGRLFSAARFDAGLALATIADEGVTLFEGVPTMYHQMLAHPDFNDTDLSSLERCTVGGQTMPTAKLDAVAEKFGCPVLELWGMTEVGGPATSHSPYWLARHGSIGLPFPGMEIKIDAGGRRAAEEAPVEGELLVRGPLVMQGYWNNPKATHDAIDSEGWLATGDIARIDEQGYLYIVDRKKDMILTAGYNIYPAELEQVIAKHPAVSMAAVAGRADDEKGEIAEAYVVKHRNAEIDAEELLAFCRDHLASYKIPRAVHFLDELPTTSTGKIMRRALNRVG